MIQIDIIGRIYDPVIFTGTETINTPPAQGQPLPGWHVNATAEVAEWAAWRVEPTAPRRVFAGVETVFYAWPDERAWLAARDGADLNGSLPAQN